ncbi:MAG: hypothetical protein DCF31_17560 [Alphaproteobacteria bacterium]|nr:MAG: hypothetical protein DCF31_17560 [Alphaproteobacteria bacterium]
MHAPLQPRRLARAWRVVRDGLPSMGRYRRYILSLAPALAVIWGVTGLYLALAPARYASQMTLILPGSGAGGSMNVESIGQASGATASAFSSATLSPTENYKRLIMADVTLRAAANRAGEDENGFPDPVIKLADQTNVVEVTMTGPTPAAAQKRATALRAAFLAGLDRLRDDEAAKREAADRHRIADLETKVRRAQRRLLAFQGTSGLVSIDQFNKRIAALDDLQDRELQARTVQGERRAETRKLAAALGISTSGARAAFLLKADPLFQSLLGRYAANATARTERGATLGEQHSAMAESGAVDASLRTALTTRGKALTGLPAATLLSFADLSVAEGRARMFEVMVNDSSRSAGADAALAEIRRQIAEQTARSGALVGQAATLSDLVRDLRVAEAVFSSALARVDTNKADPFASYPLVQTLEEPSLPRKRASPSTLLALAGALGASFLLLIGFLLLWLRQPIIQKLLPNA